MAPKRPATSPTPTKSKRSRTKNANDNGNEAVGQRRLDSFFASPTKAATTNGPSRGNRPDRKGVKNDVKGKGKALPVEVIELDLTSSDGDDEVELDGSKTAGGSGSGGQKEDRALAVKLAKEYGTLPEDVEEEGFEEGYGVAGPSGSKTAPTRASIPIQQPSPRTSRPATPKAIFGMPTTAASTAPVVYPDLTSDPLLFDVSNCPWAPQSGSAAKHPQDRPPSIPAPYSFLTHTFVTLSSTRSRIILVNTLVNTLRLIITHDPTSLLATLYLLSNSISPAYVPVEMSIGPSIISKAIQSVSGLSAAALRKLFSSTGDPGDTAFEAKSSVRTLIPHPPLLIQGVYDSLLKIAYARGNGATKQKQTIVEKLLVAAKGEESRYLVRTLAQHIRVGAVRTTMLSALSRALVLSRPPSPRYPQPPSESELYAPPELLQKVKPLPATKKKSTEPDVAREDVKERFLKAESLLKKVFVQHPNYGHIVKAILEHGFERLAEHVPLAVGSPTRSLDEIYERLGNLSFTAEFKYDGQRVQMHARRREGEAKHLVKLFSRHLEDMTEKYPDILSLVDCIFENSPEISSFIIDAEIVAVDPANGDVKSFQELSNRPKKDVNLRDVKVVVCVYAFDLMYFNDQTLLSEPFRTRRDLLRTKFPQYIPEDKYTARLDHVESCEGDDGREVVEEFFQRAVESKSEGLMIKLLDSGEVIEVVDEGDGDDVVMEDVSTSSPKKEKRKATRRKPLPATYEPDKRTSAWLKLKKDYVQGLGDSFDLVPVGGWHGMGRKNKWWSPVLLAIFDPKRDCLVAVCKCMSGFTDAFYQAMVEKYELGSDMCSKQPFPGIQVDFGDLRPSVYFKPSEVWELQGADITISPRSVAALGLISDQRGLSIRFPRFIRTREDKAIEDATGPDMLADLYRKQEGRNGGKAGGAIGGVDEGELLDPESEEEEDMEDEEEI
ncbi:hypothetical protein FRC00_001389 [Tulasnella sp. 408]|nr:hypothetical protein FRC00_001389 [Tulasnella sp. 408]